MPAWKGWCEEAVVGLLVPLYVRPVQKPVCSKQKAFVLASTVRLLVANAYIEGKFLGCVDFVPLFVIV